jgi:5-methylcytosine-specific restriction endonuclease McrA
MQIDHIEPVTPLTGWVNLDTFVTRLKVPAEEMQAICKPCHKSKSGEENETRRTSKRNKKRTA